MHPERKLKRWVKKKKNTRSRREKLKHWVHKCFKNKPRVIKSNKVFLRKVLVTPTKMLVAPSFTPKQLGLNMISTTQTADPFFIDFNLTQIFYFGPYNVALTSANPLKI